MRNLYAFNRCSEGQPAPTYPFHTEGPSKNENGSPEAEEYVNFFCDKMETLRSSGKNLSKKCWNTEILRRKPFISPVWI